MRSLLATAAFGLSLSLAIPSTAHAQNVLDIGTGTWAPGGSVTGILNGFGSNVAFQLDISPSLGYFVMDNGEVFASLGFTWDSGSGSVFFSLIPGFRYYFAMDPIYPYADAALVLGGGAGFLFGGVVGGGILIPLSNVVAIDIGLDVQLLSAGGAFVWGLPFGALGVRAFIPGKKQRG